MCTAPRKDSHASMIFKDSRQYSLENQPELQTHPKARWHSDLRLNHGQNPWKSGFPWSRRCCSRWCRFEDELQSIYRRGRTRGKIGRGKKSFELLKSLAHGQPRAAHMVKTCNTRETHVMIRVPAVLKTWGDTVRRESLGVCHGQSMVIRRVLRVGITEKSVCLAAYHWQMDFSSGWTWLVVLRQCFSSGTAADGHTPYKARPSQNLDYHSRPRPPDFHNFLCVI